jgi:50S ribosomal protein L16 3-hydroxylase
MQNELLGGHTPEEFLREYWQKKPLLIRGALPGFISPLTPEELAGLACDEDVDARLVLEEGGSHPWELRHGPFDEDEFLSLPETHWSLLVQEVDRHVPEVRALLDHFRFIPRWRIDDVMVSYAPTHGGVGAHIDNYDVFLLQGLGHRRWQIQTRPVEEEVLVADLDVRVLADFEPDAEWVLGPGDMLYLPPRIAHYGVAEDDCMTYSIGFRAPGKEDVIGGFLSHLLESVDPDERYADPDLKPAANPGEIGPEALEKVRAMAREAMRDAEIDAWFGRYITESRRGHYAEPLDEPFDPRELAESIRQGAVLEHEPAARLAFIAHGDGTATLFVAGESYHLDADLAYAAPLLCRETVVSGEVLTGHLEDRDFLMLVADLVNEGYLAILDDEDEGWDED